MSRTDQPRRARPLTELLCALALAAALTLIPVACSDDEPAPGGSAAGAGDADPEAVAVIEEWSQTLRSGDARAAAELFALPSTVENGAGVDRISDRTEALRFNLSLPCGAELVATEPDGPLTVATFRLTERPGPGRCGSGAGMRARTAFIVEDGRIVVWQRLPGTGAPSVPAAPENPV